MALRANCPACGAEVLFKTGSSVVVVCEFCRSVVARTDRGVEDLGKVSDVAESGSNYASVNVPFSLGYTYENTFSGTDEWTFDPGIFAAPFFPGSGFAGVKYLKSPVIDGAEVGLTLFSNTINGGAFDDASNSVQLFRYLSNNISTAAGDAACNTGNPQVTKICYVNTGQPDDWKNRMSAGAPVFTKQILSASGSAVQAASPAAGLMLTER